MIGMFPFAALAGLPSFHDFDAFLREIGITREDMARAKASMPEPESLPEWCAVSVLPSKIEGVGLFADHEFAKGEYIAPLVKDGKWTVAGRFANHALYPNAAPEGGQLVAICPIKSGQEITVNYRDMTKNFKVEDLQVTAVN